MKNRLLNLFLAVLFLFVAGCATPHVIVLKDGRKLESKDTPNFDMKTGFYQIETKDGDKVKLNKDEVVEIREK